MLITAISQRKTVIGIELVAVVPIGLSLILIIKFFEIDQFAGFTEILLTFVATIVIWVPETETVAESPVAQLLSHE